MKLCNGHRIIFLTVIFCMSSMAVNFALAQPACISPPNGIISWWPGDGDANDIQDNNPGMLEGDAAFDTGLVGEAFIFNGNGEVEIPNNSNLNVQEFTIEAWVFPTVLDGEIDIIFNKEETNRTIQYEIGIRGAANPGVGNIPEGHFAFFIGGISGLPNDYRLWVNGGALVSLNAWTHVALTFDGSSAVAYVNGLSTTSIEGLSGTIGNLSGPLKIGSRSDTVINLAPQEPFNGLIDEVAFYNRALSADEIAAIFNAGSEGKCKESVGGSVSGMVPENVFCWNLTTGQSVSFQTDAASWNCESEGLIVRPNDRVVTGVEGIVE